MSHRLADLVAAARQQEDDLPYPRFSGTHIALIENAIREGWQLLLADPQAYQCDLKHHREDIITDALVRVINVARDVDESGQIFSQLAETFQPIRQNSGYRNAEGTIIKSPDFAFHPIIRRPGLSAEYFALFIESKVIDTHDGKQQSTGLYFRKGVSRFLSGEYAWAMPQGMMIGYVRDGADCLESMNYYLRGKKTQIKHGVVRQPKYAKPPNPIPKVVVTMHERSAPEGSPRKPVGHIEIRHLWLSVYAAKP